MKKIAVILLISLTVYSNSHSQCNSYYNFKDGKKIELETYNAKNKKTGKIANHVKNLSEGSNSYQALIESKTFNEKGKELSAGEYTIECSNGVVSLDLKSLIPQESLSAYENMDVSFTGDNLEIPQTLRVGEKLKDSNLTGEVRDKSSGNIFSTMKFLVTDRVVEGKETITTPAGTFECFKISYNMSMNTSMMGINIPMNFKGIDFITEKEGVVKSENYNKNGKLMGYTLLSKIE